MKKPISFISTFNHYDVEESGIKHYTIRKWTQRLQNQIEKCPTHIKIRRAYTKRHFIRKITHILYWDKYVIFAWDPNDTIVIELREYMQKKHPDIYFKYLDHIYEKNKRLENENNNDI